MTSLEPEGKLHFVIIPQDGNRVDTLNVTTDFMLLVFWFCDCTF